MDPPWPATSASRRIPGRNAGRIGRTRARPPYHRRTNHRDAIYPRAALLTLAELAAHCPGDDARRSLVLQIERIVAANQGTRDGVVRNSDRTVIVSEIHTAVECTAFERDCRCGRKDAGAAVADLDCAVDDIASTVDL